MAFYLDDLDESTPAEMFGRVVRFYSGKETGMNEGEYGSPVLDTVEYKGTVETVGQLKAAFSELCDKKYADADKYVFFQDMKTDGEECLSYMPKDMEVVNGTAVMILAADQMPPMINVAELRQAVAAMPDDTGLLFRCDGANRRLSYLALEVVRFPDSADVMHILRFRFGEADKSKESAPTVKSVEADSIPLGTDQFVEQCSVMARKSGNSSFRKRPMIFEIPSVMDKRFEGKLPEGLPDEVFAKLGTLCTVDVAVKKGQHAEVQLMSFDRVKEGMKILNEPGEFDVDGTCAKMAKFKGQDLPLFFMYVGKPYEIEEMKAEAGCPVTCVLAPWGSLDESARPRFKNEIELWASWCEDPVLSWRI